jgi:putative transposase
MHEQGYYQFEWQRGFGAFSVSSANLAAVKRYIANQEKHHQKTSFRDEFISFLERSGVKYEERYLWK